MNMKCSLFLILMIITFQPEITEAFFGAPIVRLGLRPFLRHENKPTAQKISDNHISFPSDGESSNTEIQPPKGGVNQNGNGEIIFGPPGESPNYVPEDGSILAAENATDRQVITAPNINGNCPEGMKNVNGRCRKIIG